MRIYFAGPDVFKPGYAEHCERIRDWCRRAGVVPLLPSDEGLPAHLWAEPPREIAQWIFESNVQMVKSADGVICHLDPFRGEDVDSGTAFEIGLACAEGLPIFGVDPDGRSLVDRLAKPGGEG